jgi:Ca2+-binding EF-hand superfamily protein
MHKMLLSLVMAVTFLALPQIVVAEESAKDGPPGPEMLFKHLDVNHDGMIAEDEIPADLPEPLKALLKTADKNGDKKVSLEEFTAAVKEHPLPPPPFGMPPFGPGGPRMGGAPCGPLGPSHDGPHGKRPNPKELFEKFDTDKDGKLTLDEFTKGMEQLHKTMMEHARPKGPMPGGPGFPMMQGGPAGPMPPPFQMPGMMPPRQWWPGPGMMGGGQPGAPMFGPGWPMPPHGGPGFAMTRGPMQGAAPGLGGPMPPHSEPGLGAPAGAAPPCHHDDQGSDATKPLETRIADLEAKLKALEAKIEAK